MILRVRFTNCTSKKLVSNWIMYTVPGYLTLRDVFDKIFCGNPSTCVTFVSVTSKETPANTDLQEAADIIQIEELQECNRKLFIEYSLKEAQRGISEENV